jgi:dienelactone hydrolase
MLHRGDANGPAPVAVVLGVGLLLGAGCSDPEAIASQEETGEPDESSSSDEDPTDSDDSAPAIEFCEGPVEIRYDLEPGEIDAFPDDLLTEDASTATGLRIRRLHPSPPFARYPGLFDGLATLDGFGTTAPAFVRLRGSVDLATLPAPGTEADPGQSSLLLVDIDAPSPTFVEFEWRIEEELDDAITIFVDPLRPLRPGARYGLVLTRGIRDLQGDCIAPSATMRALLARDEVEPSVSRVGPRYDALLEQLRFAGVIDGPGDVSAAFVFTTQTTLDESTTIATSIKHAAAPPLEPGFCAPSGSCTRCDLTLTVADFRDDAGVIVPGEEPQRFHSVPVVAFVPAQGNGPFPTIVYAHGLDGDRTYAVALAADACSEGHAVVAIDAPKHGDHPDAPILNPALDLMGITGDPEDPFDALAARDNFRQATFDKLQLLRRIEAGMDVDESGQPDLAFERVHYFGVSLGAVTAPPFLAFAPEVRSATLVVGGVRLTDIVSDASELGALASIVTSGMSSAQRGRFMAMAQAALDRGEPEVFTKHVLVDRIEGFDTGRPQILAQMAVDDTIVPNSSTAYMLRALGMPIVGPAWIPMRNVDVEPTLPLRANLGPGRTGGLFQFKDVPAPGSTSELDPATHMNLQYDRLAHEQRMAFLRSAEEPTGAIIIDPFADR